MELVRKLFGQPIVGIAEIMKWTGFTAPGEYKIIKRLKGLKILEPLGDAEYGQKYIYADYYEIFDDAFREARAKLKDIAFHPLNPPVRGKTPCRRLTK